MLDSECTCPECGAMFSAEAIEMPNEDFAPDLLDFGQCPACDYVGDKDEFWA